MGFVKYEKENKKFITISIKGVIGLSTQIIKEFNVKQKCWCQLSYDKELKIIGIEVSDVKLDSSLKINSNTSSAQIHARPFFNFFDIDLSKKLKIQITECSDGMIVAQL